MWRRAAVSLLNSPPLFPLFSLPFSTLFGRPRHVWSSAPAAADGAHGGDDDDEMLFSRLARQHEKNREEGSCSQCGQDFFSTYEDVSFQLAAEIGQALNFI